MAKLLLSREEQLLATAQSELVVARRSEQDARERHAQCLQRGDTRAAVAACQAVDEAVSAVKQALREVRDLEPAARARKARRLRPHGGSHRKGAAPCQSDLARARLQERLARMGYVSS